MIIKEVFNDYKALYKMLNKRIDENEKEITGGRSVCGADFGLQLCGKCGQAGGRGGTT